MKNFNNTKTAEKLRKHIAKKTNEVKREVERNQKKLDDKAERIRKLRREVSQLAAKANKRVARLERNDLTDSPAYQGYLDTGKGKFGVKGKNYHQVIAEKARVMAFLKANTSTVRGYNKNLKDIAKNTGMKYKNLTDLRAKAKVLWALDSKIRQNLAHIEQLTTAIDYNKVWAYINEYVEEAKIDLAKAGDDIDLLADKISKMIIEYEKPEKLDFSRVGGKSHWYKLPKN